MKRSFSFTRELKDQAYRNLLDFALGECDFALLVVRPALPLSAKGRTMLARLAGFLKEQKESSQWPGTVLLDEVASVFLYHLTSASVEVLKSATDGLYKWEQPDLPEDLCLLRSDGEPWLVSVVHEKDSYLYLSVDEEARLFNTLPELNTMLKNDEG